MDAIAYVWDRWKGEPGPSAAEQEKQLRQVAEPEGWSITRVESDGWGTARAARRRAIKDLGRGRSDLLVACDLASLVSSSRDFTKFFSAAAREGIRVIVVESGIDTAASDGQLVSRVAVELEDVDVALRQRHMKESKQARRGRKPMPPNVRQKILALRRNKKMSYGDIARYLDSQEVPTPQGGQRWYGSTIKAVVDSANAQDSGQLAGP